MELEGLSTILSLVNSLVAFSLNSFDTFKTWFAFKIVYSAS